MQITGHWQCKQLIPGFYGMKAQSIRLLNATENTRHISLTHQSLVLIISNFFDMFMITNLSTIHVSILPKENLISPLLLKRGKKTFNLFIFNQHKSTLGLQEE